MSIPAMPAKTSDEVLDYKIDMTAELAGRLEGGANDTLVSAVWTVPTGLTLHSSEFDISTATVWLAGGLLGSIYEVFAVMITAGGRTYHRSFKIAIKDH